MLASLIVFYSLIGENITVIFNYWRQLLHKLRWWNYSLCNWQQCSRSSIRTKSNYLKIIYLACPTRNESKPKCDLLLSTTNAFNFEISETVIHNSNSKKLLGVIFDNKLKFEKHIITICLRANRKLNALARLTPYMELGKRRILMNAFLNSQFNYCPVFLDVS